MVWSAAQLGLHACLFPSSGREVWCGSLESTATDGKAREKVGEAQMLLLSRRYRPDPIARLPLQRAGQGLSRDG